MTNRLKVRFQFWRQPAAEWTAENPILLEDEPGYEDDTNKWKFGDGIRRWNDLPYAVPAIGGGGGGGGEDGLLTLLTSDGGLLYKIIAFDNTTIKAIPAALDPPLPPSGLFADIRLTSVTLHWTPSPTLTGVHYDIFRNAQKIGSTSVGATSFRDVGVSSGNTYLYHVRSIDPYGQPGGSSPDISVFIDPALNVAPTVQVTIWPDPLPTIGKGLIRVCGSDLDAQALAYALTIDENVIEPTDDPSIWLYSQGGT